MPTSAFALTSAPDSTTWGTTGKVYALAKNGNTLFVGGTFKKMTSPDGTQKFSKMKNLAAVDMTTGAPITTWQPIVEELSDKQQVIASAVDAQTRSTNEISANVAKAAERATSIADFVAANRR